MVGRTSDLFSEKEHLEVLQAQTNMAVKNWSLKKTKQTHCLCTGYRLTPHPNVPGGKRNFHFSKYETLDIPLHHYPPLPKALTGWSPRSQAP